jgi:hypothetical protein
MKSHESERSILQDGTLQNFSYAFLAIGLQNIPVALGFIFMQTRIYFSTFKFIFPPKWEIWQASWIL